MRNIFKFKTIRFTLLTIIFRLLIDYYYIKYISTQWEYNGFHLIINREKLLISYLFLLFFLYLIPLYKKEKLSHFLVILLFYTVYIPISCLYGLLDKSNTFFLITNLSFVILVLYIIILDRRSNTNLVLEGEFYSKLIPLIHLTSIFVFLAMTIQNINNINIQKVLNLREVYQVRQGVTYAYGMNYFFSWQTKVINPYMIGIYYKNRSKVGFFTYLAFQIWMYILTGHKLVLFIPIIVFIIIRFSKWLKDLPDLLSWGFVGLLAISRIELLFNDKSIILDFFIRRVLYVPALNSNYHYDFFSNYGFQYWSYTLIGKIFNLSKDFSVQPTFVIGEVFYGNPNTNAVTGYLGTEYMNGGVLGIILATIVLVVIFKLMDIYSERLDRDIVLITIIAPIYTLWNTGILTALLTGGVFISILMLGQTRIIQPSSNNQFLEDKNGNIIIQKQ